MNNIPVMVLKNKTNSKRYLSANADVGDWEDENLDVTLDDIQNAYVIVRKDLAIPTIEDFEEHRKCHAELKRALAEKWGHEPFMTMDFETVCEHYEPVNIEITQEQYEYALEMMED
ncbi:hypothetical protein [Paenibacillus segetis]|uniref:Uncharacterized protein n=1 Tax=Paenibacillus segetis TaxID=1325360 RepID=A0ABQ1Y9R9_9BACL|nr:hypothetical protein [Paenibacillus segetis]GGH17162.1 hypothetical protein GCM10008013_12360 [Paenibacillus segetis]